MAKRGYSTVKVPLRKSKLTIFASPRLGTALKEITGDMSLYSGVRFTQILEAVYQQGKKDGAAEAFNEVSKGVKNAQRLVPHKRPGRPKKTKG